MREYKRRYSFYKGVTWDREKCRWMAFIKRNGKQKTLGRFKLEKDAAAAYALAERGEWVPYRQR